MDFLELAKARYSCRRFSDKKIEREKLEKVLETGRIAPTAKNRQPQRVFIIESEEGIKKVREVCNYHFYAPTVLLFTFDKNVSGKNSFTGKEYGYEDVAIAITQMMLAATSLGLGTTYVGAFDYDLTAKTFDLDDNLVPVAYLPIGYPREDDRPSRLHDTNIPFDEMFKFI